MIEANHGKIPDAKELKMGKLTAKKGNLEKGFFFKQKKGVKNKGPVRILVPHTTSNLELIF